MKSGLYRVNDGVFYWSSDRPVQDGFRVPKARPRAAHLEAVFEEVRKREAPKAPSRLDCVFVCPIKDSGFCQSGKSKYVYRVRVQGTVFTTDGGFWTEATFGRIENAAGWAMSYWNPDSNPNRLRINRAEESLVDGTVIVEALVSKPHSGGNPPIGPIGMSPDREELPMSTNLRKALIQVAASFPLGSDGRRELLAVLSGDRSALLHPGTRAEVHRIIPTASPFRWWALLEGSHEVYEVPSSRPNLRYTIGWAEDYRGLEVADHYLQGDRWVLAPARRAEDRVLMSESEFLEALPYYHFARRSDWPRHDRR